RKKTRSVDHEREAEMIPFIFFRNRVCTPSNALKPNSHDNKRRTAVVILAKCWDCKSYSSAWMGNPALSQTDCDFDYTMIPDIDVSDYENIFIFDSDDSAKNERDALLKMKELWSKVELTD